MRVAETPGRTMRFASYLLTVSMVLGFPGPGLVHGATAATAPSASGSLSVETDPPGATVLVDGQAWGTTPVAVRPIAPGDHRVRVVKQGYLDNSRVVSVQAGQVGRVQVKLTPSGEPSAVRAQVDTAPPPQQEGGGGSKKALLIGLGVVAAGAGAYFLLKDGNKPPVAGTVVANPTTGLQGATSISFSAQGASDPNNDPLTYEWNFGDGGSGSGATATHVYASSGSFNVTVTVKDPKELSATASGSVTIRSLAGTWRGTISSGTGFNAVVTLAHSGSSISGNYTDQFGSVTAGPITAGSVSDPRTVRFQVNPSCCDPFTFSGTAGADLNSITGTVNGSGFVNDGWTLTRQ